MIWPVTGVVIGLGVCRLSVTGRFLFWTKENGGQSRTPPSGLRRILIIVGNIVLHSGYPRNTGCRVYWQLSELIWESRYLSSCRTVTEMTEIAPELKEYVLRIMRSVS